MDQAETAAYLKAKFDQIREAVARGDAGTAAAALDSIRTDGHEQAWRAAWDVLLDTAPERITRMFSTSGQAGQ